MTEAVAADHLRQMIERVERLTEEKAALQADIREVYAEAKGHGFNVKVMKQVVRERAMDDGDRAEFFANRNLYLEALGMASYDDTPLGRSATPPPDPDPEPEPDAPADDPEPADPHPGVNIPAARAMGRAAGANGTPVTANPFPAGDERRAAWDEAWCAETGEDGMGIPKDLRRPGEGKPKPGAGGEDDADSGGEARA